MFLKPVNCNFILFYGVFTNDAEISNILRLKKMSHDDFYGYIYSQGLQYQRVGDNKRAKEYIVGKQLDYYNDFVAMKIKYNEGKFRFEHMNGQPVPAQLTPVEEMEVNHKLLELGFFPNTNYYLFHNYDSNLIK